MGAQAAKLQEYKEAHTLRCPKCQSKSTSLDPDNLLRSCTECGWTARSDDFVRKQTSK